MKLLAVTQSVALVGRHEERRDTLDQRWPAFLRRCGFIALPVPNHLPSARALFDKAPVAGLLLTGGNTLSAYGGDAPERDAVERWLLNRFILKGLPVLGVCRGMQVIQHRFGVKLRPVEGHVSPAMRVTALDRPAVVNSYHNFGAVETCRDLEVWARAEDGVVKAVSHRARPVLGLMWHPERLEPFRARDTRLFSNFFNGRCWRK